MLYVIRRRIGRLTETVFRFPVTILFLAAAAVMTAMSISGRETLSRYIMTCGVGTAACAATQVLYERFFTGRLWRLVMAVAGLALALLFFLSVRTLPENRPELLIRPA
ncbi:MAG: hypothetical protein GX847_09405, partial [Clostridiales bacterium]|nr:hypothetical protein [Clostridiales bacterium]